MFANLSSNNYILDIIVPPPCAKRESHWVAWRMYTFENIESWFWHANDDEVRLLFHAFLSSPLEDQVLIFHNKYSNLTFHFETSFNLELINMWNKP